MRLEDTVAGALQNYPPGTMYLAAVSGGADSVAMLSALASLAAVRNKSLDLRCIHVEHGIRPQTESRGDAEFVKKLCKDLKVPCKIVSIKPGRIAAAAKERGIGIEAAARLFRHRVWFREAKRLSCLPDKPQVKILVAHTADDALETALMRILSGAGPSGLAPMPASRGCIIRPLITLRRQDVTAYLTEKKIPWREDKTNSDIRFFRNRIRRRLIPLLNESFPNWRTTINALAETQSLAADFIQNEASARVLWQTLLPLQTENAQSPALYADADLFFAQPAIIREEALFQGIDLLLAQLPENARPQTIKRSNIRRFCKGEKKAVDLGELRLHKDSKRVIISIPIHGEYGFSLLINKPGLYTLKGTAIEVCEIQADGNEGEGAFLALLPLVIRPGFKEDAVKCQEKHSGNCVAAVDIKGTAACICQGRLIRRGALVQRGALAQREAAQVSNNGRLYMVRIAGSEVTDVR